jgi:hypothetical protein
MQKPTVSVRDPACCVAPSLLNERYSGAISAKRKVKLLKIDTKARFSFFLLTFFAFIPKVRPSKRKNLAR